MELHVLVMCILSVSGPATTAETWHSFQEYEYHIVYSPYVNSYAEAETGCAARSATVANVKTKEIQKFLVNRIGNMTDFPYSLYIGATRITNTQSFQWTDGTSADVGQWAAGEPNNINENENCVIMGWIHSLDQSYKWRTVTCSTFSRYICQRKISETTFTMTSTTSQALSAATGKTQITILSHVATTVSLLTPTVTNRLTPPTIDLTLNTKTTHQDKPSEPSETTKFVKTTQEWEFKSTNAFASTEQEQDFAPIVYLGVIGLLSFTNLISLAVIVKLWTQRKSLLPQNTNRNAKETTYEVPMPAPVHNYEDVQTGGNNHAVSYANINVEDSNKHDEYETAYIKFSQP